ncbi:MAG TPA: hypothetical protein IAC03_01405 [Candidatus Coprenecus pullistercoris]|nr:hypothetical protein [Candidatus Coprenecus pullistercoris]
MRKFIVFSALSAAILLTSCKTESNMSVYNGDYTVDGNTSINVNGYSADLSDYENAEISISMADGQNCDIILRNFITGQPEVIIPGILSEDASGAGISFNGDGSTTDRTVAVEGSAAGTSISSITITEHITVDGIPGEWAIGSVSVTFYHPDLETIDFSEAVPGLQINVQDLIAEINTSIARTLEESGPASHLWFTEDGYFNEPPLCSYYIRPQESTINIFLRKSIVTELTDELKNNPDAMNLISMLGFTSLIENPQSMNIALQYRIENNGITLIASQTLLDPYEEMLAQPLSVIRALLDQYITYETLAGDPDLEGIITPENFPAFKQVLMNTYDTLTDGRAEYSMTLGLVPYSAAL